MLHYIDSPLSAAEVSRMPGLLALEFGNGWCGFCQTSAPAIAAALQHRPDIRHIQIADGKGKRLGRHFGVKLWPTLIFLDDGLEVARVVRPDQSETVSQAISRLRTAD
ncbi:thioredoxin 1 [Lampropedia hyalina DSM 16112]|jgi:thioredoxin 1|uniref:Thioredoxin 1 n=1 Tax=Lampropedia hyalina DSM 16112 TaxID=1122156 RepID=A0A1M5AEN4_9BURK|nr:thioredoxin family protein [Lampropedia hyalina]SHF28627.1 thioredoxin 1 [Lampropedia hyalina DSM 16112]